MRAREFEREVVERRLQGQTYDTIAVALNCSLSGAHEAFWRCVDRIPAESLERFRAESLQRIEMLRAKAWVRARGKHAPVNVLAFLLALEDRQSRLLGLDAAVKFDATARPAPVDAEERVAQLRKNLTEDELRTLLNLMRKGSGQVSPPRMVEATATHTPVPAVVIEPEFNLPPSATPTPGAYVTRSVEPSRSFLNVDEFCREFSLSRTDPTLVSAMPEARTRWLQWHQQSCRANPGACPHRAVLGR